MSKENKLVPELRFPEFKGDGEWSTTTIGKVFNSFSGGTPITSNKKYYDGEIPFIRSAEINKTSTELFITGEGLNNSSAKLVNKGDLLVALYGANSGDSAISKINGAINQAILCLQSDYSNGFVYNFLTLKKDWIVSRFIQGGQGNLSGEIIKSIIIPFPKKHEQQKIASCLSSLDELITAYNEKLDLLKAHKKGLMQNLFPQEGEKVPEVRFQEFEKDGEWMEKELGELADVSKLAGYEFTKHIVYEDKGNIIALRGLNIKDNKLNLSEVKYIDNSELSKLSRSKLYIDDLMFTYIGTIGEVALIEENDKYYLAPNVSRIRANKKMINAHFLLQYFNVPFFKTNEIAKYISSSSQPALTMENVRKFKIYLPSHQEQQKIASCLSALDELITAQAEKIEQLKKHKKGLMQGLFPTMNH